MRFKLCGVYISWISIFANFVLLHLWMLDTGVFKYSWVEYLQISHSQMRVPGYVYHSVCHTVMVWYKVRFFCEAVDLLHPATCNTL